MVWHHHLGGLGGCHAGVEDPDDTEGHQAADDLSRDEVGDGRRCDARETVGEHAPDGDGRVGEAGRTREEVGGTDVGAHCGWSEARAARAGQGEDDEQEARGGHHFGEPVWARGPMSGRDRNGGLGEHRVGQDGSADTPQGLEGKIRASVPPPHSAEACIDEGHDRIEVCARNRAEHHNDGEEPGGRGRGVLEKLQPDVSRRKVLRRDAGTDHDGRQEGAAQELCGQASPQGGVPHRPASRLPAELSSRPGRFPPRSPPPPRPPQRWERNNPLRRRCRSRPRHRPERCRPPMPHRRGH